VKFKTLYVVSFIVLVGVSLYNINLKQKVEIKETTKEVIKMVNVESEMLQKMNILIKENEQLKSKIKIKSSEVVSLKEQNKTLLYRSYQFEKTIKTILGTGKKPKNYQENQLDKDNSGKKMTYVGEFTMTYYSPTTNECQNSNGITYTGEPVEAGVTIAVDKKYWKLGSRLYVEGFGEVVCNDIGSAIKGRNRLDLCTFNTKLAMQLGKTKAKVWKIEE